MSAMKLTAKEYIAVRDAVADKLKPGSNIQTSTRIRMAESLLEAEFIDVAEVLVNINMVDVATDAKARQIAVQKGEG